MIRWSDKAQKLSRRRFLISAGGAAIAIPVLSSLPWTRSRNALAAESPRRFVVFWTPDGFERSTEMGFKSATPNLLSFAKGSALEPLAPFRNDLILLENMRLAGQGMQTVNPHWGMRQLLTGAPYSQMPGSPIGNYASMDQWLAKRFKDRDPLPLAGGGVFSRRQFGADYGELSYQDGGIAVARETDPRAVYKRLFMALNANTEEAERIYAAQKSVLDATYADLREIMGQVSTEDRLRLEAHSDAYRDMEKALAPYNGNCQPFIGPPDLASDYLKIGTWHIKLVAMALRCDLTRVASIQWSYPVSNTPASFAGVSETSHNLGHHIGADYVNKINKIQRFYAERFADLLRQLSEAQEGGSTVLHNTVVLWGSELDDMPLSHTVAKMPFLLAGQAGGYLRTGRIVDGKQRYNNDLLVTIGNAMGLRPQNGKYGDANLCMGEMQQLR